MMSPLSLPYVEMAGIFVSINPPSMFGELKILNVKKKISDLNYMY